MSITKDQAQMLTTLACASRPTGARQWNPDDVMAEIQKLHTRSLPAVICAVIRAAADRGAQRPQVISSNGSHWGDSQHVSTWVPNAMDRDQRCSVCSHSEEVCRMRYANDHDFESVAAALQRKADADAVAEKVAALKAELAPTAGPTERKTLTDMAEANPDLHARVEALRAANPGLTPPATQATEEQS